MERFWAGLVHSMSWLPWSTVSSHIIQSGGRIWQDEKEIRKDFEFQSVLLSSTFWLWFLLTFWRLRLIGLCFIDTLNIQSYIKNFSFLMLCCIKFSLDFKSEGYEIESACALDTLEATLCLTWRQSAFRKNNNSTLSSANSNNKLFSILPCSIAFIDKTNYKLIHSRLLLEGESSCCNFILISH